MKKLAFICMTALLTAFVSFGGEDPVTSATVEKITVKELLEKYDGNVVFEDGTSLADLDLNATIILGKAGNPCEGIGDPCGAALALAQVEARAAANACCCVITAGVECCDQGQLMAILFIVTPTHC